MAFDKKYQNYGVIKIENNTVRLYESQQNYLTLNTSGGIPVMANWAGDTVNVTMSDGKIKTSFIIITVQGKNIIEEVNINLRQHIDSTNNFSILKNSATYISEDFAFIKLPYYYSENIKVGNEHLSFSIAGIENINLNNLKKNIYEVRFFVYRKYNLFNPYHRCVQTCFVSESKLYSLFTKFPIEFKENGSSKKKKENNNYFNK